MNCPICLVPNTLYYINTKRENQQYYRCPECHSIALHPQYYLTPEEEKARYLTHNNDVNDPSYQKFVRPVVQTVTSQINIGHRGLDYGAGTGPVITKLLEEKGYKMTTYDPIFILDPHALKATYDFIVCCEVVEHFHNPQQEFIQFKKLLHYGGLLIIKTELVTSNIKFTNWYYKNDPTHTIFYSPKGIHLLLSKNGLKALRISPRLVVAKKT